MLKLPLVSILHDVLPIDKVNLVRPEHARYVVFLKSKVHLVSVKFVHLASDLIGLD
jgi:hypothetical protein